MKTYIIVRTVKHGDYEVESRYEIQANSPEEAREILNKTGGK